MALAGPVCADPDEDAFVAANITGILYHEIGHAMVDLLALPVFGQEEDAADVASVLLVEALHEADEALDLAYDASFGFAAEAMARDAEGHDVAWWDTHGPDEQRFFNTVCLFYGADPDGRDGFAQDMDLPEDRAETCEEEFQLAWDSWGPVFDDLEDASGDPITLVADGDSLSHRVAADLTDRLNAVFRWPEPLTLIVEPCDEANAYFYPDGREIVLCTEFEPYLRQLWRLSE
ncbi:DUF4344 domain-containing metallopeptidase [Thalassococcus arenae]